eukprot:m.41641 g.41641  ORF g.41641 m.41641 type:complete len:330 (+) comp10444_c0_seq1:82-1071(+)
MTSKASKDDEQKVKRVHDDSGSDDDSDDDDGGMMERSVLDTLNDDADFKKVYVCDQATQVCIRCLGLSSTKACECKENTALSARQYGILFRTYAGDAVAYMAEGAKEIALVTAKGVTNVAVDATIGGVLNGVLGFVSGVVTGVVKTSASLVWSGTKATGRLLWWLVSGAADDEKKRESDEMGSFNDGIKHNHTKANKSYTSTSTASTPNSSTALASNPSPSTLRSRGVLFSHPSRKPQYVSVGVQAELEMYVVKDPLSDNCSYMDAPGVPSVSVITTRRFDEMSTMDDDVEITQNHNTNNNTNNSKNSHSTTNQKIAQPIKPSAPMETS